MLSHSSSMTASFGRHGVRLNSAIGERKVLINPRDAIVHDDLRILAHDAQNLSTGKRRADAVSVGPRVRGHDETATRPNFL